jgi:cyclophilin family peptidyl-prolyl cis-trans isomerase
MSPIAEPRKRVGNPSQKLQKKSHKWMYIALVLIIVAVIAIGAVVLLQNPWFPSQNNTNNNNNNNNTTTANPIAVFDTTLGTFKVELFKDKMPITVNNFVKLVNDGFYNGLIFHRIGDNFMIQGGGYYSNGTRKSSPYGNIQYETSDVKHVDGAISMASTGAKVGGAAEFFICEGAQTGLDGNYAAFGVTIEGLDVVRSIAAQPHPDSGDGTGKPTTDIIINSITIVSS